MTNDQTDSLTSVDDTEGLAVDLPLLLRFARPVRLIRRRHFLTGMVGGAGAVALLVACGSDTSSSAAATQVTTATSNTAAAPTTAETTIASRGDAATAGDEIPDETAGPYPGDGTNGPNALTTAGVVRNDIRTSFGALSGTADGIETQVDLTIVDADTGVPIPGAAVYLWHCSRDGEYSLYDVVDQNYLRGVQVADDSGRLSFTSIFPGCYAGRWPHAHFEVYASIDEATNGRRAMKTSQIAYPEAACTEAYATTGYESSVRNLAGLSLANDNVFADGANDQLATITGSPTAGYGASLLVRV